MATGTYDTTMNQGDTWRRNLKWNDSAGDPMDLTGYTARMQLRTSVDSVDVVIELTTGNGRITITLPNQIDVEISAEDTALIDPGSYKYDLEMIAGTDVHKLLRGKIKVIAEVTK